MRIICMLCTHEKPGYPGACACKHWQKNAEIAKQFSFSALRRRKADSKRDENSILKSIVFFAFKTRVGRTGKRKAKPASSLHFPMLLLHSNRPRSVCLLFRERVIMWLCDWWRRRGRKEALFYKYKLSAHYVRTIWDKCASQSQLWALRTIEAILHPRLFPQCDPSHCCCVRS